jgi:hypothetical protein
MKLRTFRYTAPCSLVGAHRCFRDAYCLHHQGHSSHWRWSQCLPLKPLYTPMRLHGATSRKVVYSSHRHNGIPPRAVLILKITLLGLLCTLVQACRRFRGACCLQRLGLPWHFTTKLHYMPLFQHGYYLLHVLRHLMFTDVITFLLKADSSSAVRCLSMSGRWARVHWCSIIGLRSLPCIQQLIFISSRKVWPATFLAI